jgi:two-component system response regulator FixJ
MRGGASDFIEKPFDDTVLIEAIQYAMKQPSAAPGDESLKDVHARLGTLTPRERQVLDCLVAGKPNKITAHDLGMSIRTVEVHRARIMQKMQVRSLSELVRHVIAAQ